ncbi:MAG: stalk domain-containing protein [Turicibacter sp.]|nr:stalk domain-containing protein [Turicibacter sp.]
MKKMILLVALVGAVFLPTALYGQQINVNVDGVPVNFVGQLPVIIEGRTLVPVRGVFETLGFGIAWNGETRQAILSSGVNEIVITIDSSIFTLNGESHTLEVPAQIISDSTMIPLRDVLESVGYTLAWEGETSTVQITSAVAWLPTPDIYVPTPVATPEPITFPTPDPITFPTPAPIPTPTPITPTAPTTITLGGTEYDIDVGAITKWDMQLSDEDIQVLAQFTNLHYLDLGGEIGGIGSNITDLTPLANLTHLRVLILNNNQITDLTPLANLHNLTTLWLHNNQITDLTPLANLPNLTNLIIFNNPIQSLEPVSHIENLVTEE